MDSIRSLFRVLGSIILAVLSVAMAVAVFFFGSIIATFVMIVGGILGLIFLVAYGIYEWMSEKDDSA